MYLQRGSRKEHSEYLDSSYIAAGTQHTKNARVMDEHTCSCPFPNQYDPRQFLTYTGTAASVLRLRQLREIDNAEKIAVESVSLNQYFQCMIRSSPAPSVTSKSRFKQCEYCSSFQETFVLKEVFATRTYALRAMLAIKLM